MERVRRRLALFALAVIVGHHVGTLFKPLGDVGDTRWADWIDLTVPLAVLGTAASVLVAARLWSRRPWAVFAVGAVVYTQGHGIHLAANSIGNVHSSDVAHLWDETVSHYIWYSGLTIVVGALALALAGKRFRVTPAGWVLAGLLGITWATNTIEGGTAWFGLVVAVALAAWGARSAGTNGRLLTVAYGVAFIALAGWGIWHGGFPQFSELGWI